MISGDHLVQPLKGTVLETKAQEGKLLAQLRGAGAGGVRGRAARCHIGAGRDLDRSSSPGPFSMVAPWLSATGHSWCGSSSGAILLTR